MINVGFIWVKLHILGKNIASAESSYHLVGLVLFCLFVFFQKAFFCTLVLSLWIISLGNLYRRILFSLTMAGK